MSALGAHPVLLLALTTAAGVAIRGIGIRTRLLQSRAQPRRCPACGRTVTARVCEHCRS